MDMSIGFPVKHSQPPALGSHTYLIQCQDQINEAFFGLLLLQYNSQFMTVLNYLLSQKVELLEYDKFNHLTACF